MKYPMGQYIHAPFAVALFIAVVWTTAFSLAIKPPIRGFRNLGILASYVLLPIFLFIAGWKLALLTWTAFGVAGGAIYMLWELLQRLRTPAGEEKPAVSLSHVIYGLLAWPIMVPEAIEYALAEVGILPTPPSSTSAEAADATAGGSPDSSEFIQPPSPTE